MFTLSWPGRFILNTLRIFTTRSNKFFVYKIADIMVYLMNIFPISSGLNLRNSTFKQCKETILVTISPKNYCFPNDKTIERWHLKARLKLTNRKGIYIK